jgi:hypothetical protein
MNTTVTTLPAMKSGLSLRHAGQLARNKGRFDKTCAVGSIFFSIAGALGLIPMKSGLSPSAPMWEM